MYCNIVSTEWGGPDGIEALSLGPIFLQGFDTVGWVIWSVKKPSSIWPIMCLVGH